MVVETRAGMYNFEFWIGNFENTYTLGCVHIRSDFAYEEH